MYQQLHTTTNTTGSISKVASRLQVYCTCVNLNGAYYKEELELELETERVDS